MIFGNINHEKTYSNLSKDLLTCFEYTKKNSLADFEKGSYAWKEQKVKRLIRDSIH